MHIVLYMFYIDMHEMKKTEARNILVRVPVPLLKKLDKAAKHQGRSRTSEVVIRLADSLKRPSTEATAV